MTHPGADDFTTTEGPPCPRPDLLENNICDNEIRMERGCIYDHQDCRHNPEKDAMANQMCSMISSIACDRPIHQRYPYCQACGGHPMKSWLKTLKELQDQLDQLQAEMTTTPKASTSLQVTSEGTATVASSTTSFLLFVTKYTSPRMATDPTATTITTTTSAAPDLDLSQCPAQLVPMVKDDFCQVSNFRFLKIDHTCA